MVKTIVVIGNGIAALSAVEKIRQADTKSRIIMYGQEQFHTYNRLELSKRITKEYAPEEILIKPGTWYEEHNVELQLGQAVMCVDLENKTVTDSAERVVQFTHLLLANGGYNFVPPIPGINLGNVFSLRTLEDAQQIRAAASGAKRLLMIGGGLLGLEMAWQFKQAGLAIAIVEMFPQLMPRQLDPETSKYLEDVIKTHGIELILGGGVDKLEGTATLTGYRLKGEEAVREGDLCIYSTGMRPNIDLYKETGLNINHGIVVDEGMRTNVADVYAAGDVSEFGGRVYGLWAAARVQGAVAGENILGGDARFVASNPITNINVFDQTITSLGEVQPEGAVVSQEQVQDKVVLKKLFFKGELLCGGLFINDQKDVLTLRKALEQGVNVPAQTKTTYADALAYVKEVVGTK